MARLKNQAEIAEEIGRMVELSRAELALRWTSIFGSPPPKGIKRGLLERAYAHGLQTNTFGGLKPSARRALVRRAAGTPTKTPAADHSLRPGMRLIREWHGVVHQVDVVHDGIVWKGKNYRSLSAVAKAITGTGWSGPRFFGL